MELTLTQRIKKHFLCATNLITQDYIIKVTGWLNEKQ